MTMHFDEEALLKTIKIFELSSEITKLTWGWDNHPDAVKIAHELMAKGQNLFVEISEFDKRIGSSLGITQRKQIEDALADLQKLIPYMKNKIKPQEGFENNSEAQVSPFQKAV